MKKSMLLLSCCMLLSLLSRGAMFKRAPNLRSQYQKLLQPVRSMIGSPNIWEVQFRKYELETLAKDILQKVIKKVTDEGTDFIRNQRSLDDINTRIAYIQNQIDQAVYKYKDSPQRFAKLESMNLLADYVLENFNNVINSWIPLVRQRGVNKYRLFQQAINSVNLEYQKILNAAGILNSTMLPRGLRLDMIVSPGIAPRPYPVPKNGANRYI